MWCVEDVERINFRVGRVRTGLFCCKVENIGFTPYSLVKTPDGLVFRGFRYFSGSAFGMLVLQGRVPFLIFLSHNFIFSHQVCLLVGTKTIPVRRFPSTD